MASERALGMILSGLAARPRLLASFCAILAVATGIVHMLVGGAPVHFAWVNIAALLIGLIIIACVRLNSQRQHMGFLLLSALALLLTALFGASVQGAHRWIALGPVLLQPAMLLLPAMICIFAYRRSFLSTIAIILAATAMALQPDRSMAAALLLATLVILAMRREWTIAGTAIASAIACLVAFWRPDDLPAVPFVEGVYQSAFQLHPLLGVCTVAASIILFLPLFAKFSGNNRSPAYALASVWAALMIAAAVGNYPLPLIGYGASAILGYALSMAFLTSMTADE